MFLRLGTYPTRQHDAVQQRGFEACRRVPGAYRTACIQVAKQVRTVPVRGFGAEEGFDAKECDLRKLCFPPPTPILQNIVKCFKTYGKNIQKMS